MPESSELLKNTLKKDLSDIEAKNALIVNEIEKKKQVLNRTNSSNRYPIQRYAVLTKIDLLDKLMSLNRQLYNFVAEILIDFPDSGDEVKRKNLARKYYFAKLEYMMIAEPIEAQLNRLREMNEDIVSNEKRICEMRFADSVDVFVITLAQHRRQIDKQIVFYADLRKQFANSSSNDMVGTKIRELRVCYVDLILKTYYEIKTFIVKLLCYYMLEFTVSEDQVSRDAALLEAQKDFYIFEYLKKMDIQLYEASLANLKTIHERSAKRKAERRTQQMPQNLASSQTANNTTDNTPDTTPQALTRFVRSQKFRIIVGACCAAIFVTVCAYAFYSFKSDEIDYQDDEE